jgi:hypothetical protein
MATRHTELVDFEDVENVDDVVRYLTRQRVTPPDSYRGAYLVERPDGSKLKFKPEGFHDAELREIHRRVTGSEIRNPARRGAAVNRPPRDNPEEDWRQRRRMIDGYGYEVAELLESGADDEEWRQLERRVKASELNEDDKVYVLDKLKRAWDRDVINRHKSRRRSNPGRDRYNVYHPAPDDKSLRRDGTPFAGHCEHGLAPPKACHTCHPRPNCEICTELRSNPGRFVNRPPRERNPASTGPAFADNPGLYNEIEQAAKRQVTTGREPSSPRVTAWIKKYPTTWAQMVTRFSRERTR